jgi:uncharacterized protein YhbP (UPF0306 family)
MDVGEQIKRHLSYKEMMQIATAQGDQPWICTVFFVADELQNLYWLSSPERRHSQEIARNQKVAIAVPVKSDWPVIGIQAEGVATVVQDAEEVKHVMELYVTKYGKGKDFYDNFVKGTNQHNLYKFTPNTFVLFDEVNFAGDPRQVWKQG